MMKILISHSSKNANYGQALVDLLVAVGVNAEQIIFTSNDAFGIPNSQNIFDWLKARISEKPHVVYLLSTAYYGSIACLNEMGAAWIVENEHTIVFTPEFQISSYEFQNGALDPREMGFRINNQDRVTAFIETLRSSFPISKNAVFVSQKIREFIHKVESFETPNVSLPLKEILTERESNVPEKIEIPIVKNTIEEKEVTKEKTDPISTQKKFPNLIGNSLQVIKFFNDLQDDKLKDEEILLLHYIIETARVKLGTGWKAAGEVENIKTWEDVNSINSKLSSGYDEIIRRFGMKKLTEVSELTSSNNPREVMIVSDLSDILFDLPNEINLKIQEAIARNEKVDFWKSSNEDNLPF